MDVCEEEETMKTYICEEWGNCNNLRIKISNEGLGYFYECYTTVPVTWPTYARFAQGSSCWCGKCTDTDSDG